MRIFLVFILVALLNGCNGASNKDEKNNRQRSFFQWLGYSNKIEGLLPVYDNAKLIKLTDDINTKALVLNDLIDSLYYIKLGRADQVSIEAIDKIVFAGENIVIIDKRKMKGLYFFSGNGAFLGKIGELGKGPNEYLSASDVSIDRNSGNIVVLDQYGKKLLYYDTNGFFLKEMAIDFHAKDLSVLEYGSCTYYQLDGVNMNLKGKKGYCLLITDEKQKVINCSFPYSYRDFCPKLTFGRITDFINTKNATLFNPYLTNDIYEIKRDTITLKYKLDLGRRDILHKINKNTTDKDYLNHINSNDYLYFNGDFLESKQHLFFKFGNNSYCFYDTQTDSIIVGNHFSQKILDKTQPYLEFSTPIAVKDEWFVSVIWPFSISDEQKELINKTDNPTFKAFKNLSDLDNPILLFFKIKI